MGKIEIHEVEATQICLNRRRRVAQVESFVQDTVWYGLEKKVRNVNAAEYARVKADAFYDKKRFQIGLESDVIKLKNLLLVSYQKWQQNMRHVISSHNRTSSSTSVALWKNLETYTESTQHTKIVVEPIAEYLSSAKAYRHKCSLMCSTMKDLTRRTIDICVLLEWRNHFYDGG